MRRSTVRLAALAAALAACGEVPAPRRCASAADCATDARCIQEVCVADAPPVAVITAPPSFLSNVSYVFGSSGSYDPDAGDAVASRQWSLTPAQAPCPASPDAAATEALAVVFPCAGSFDVKLVVTDQLGVPSAPRVLRVLVTQSVDPPTVVVGPDLVLGHRCAGDPLLCTPLDESLATTFALSAAATGPAAGGFAYRWRYQLPPALEGKPAPTVTFSPDEASPAPVVAVATQGTAIAGPWDFVVEATDSRGLVAVGTQRVTIGNRPPEIQGAGAPLIKVPHVFNPSAPGAVTGTMAALGTTPIVAVADPDGDPFEAAFSSSHSGDGTNAFLMQDQGDHAGFSVVVLYGGPADGAYLIGPGVSRSIGFTATDVNGGSAATAWTVTVTNRPPRLVSQVPALTVGHAFDAAGSQYLATATLSRFVDDDGDPLLPVAERDPQCLGRAVSGGSVVVECSVPYAGVPVANHLAGVHVFDAGVSDPWQATTAPTQLTVTNRAPQQAVGSVSTSRSCTTGACCLLDPVDKVCLSWKVSCPAASGASPAVATDPDGDPITIGYAGDGCVSASPSLVTCVPGACPGETYSVCGFTNVCDPLGAQAVSVTFTDGDLSGSGTVQVY